MQLSFSFAMDVLYEILYCRAKQLVDVFLVDGFVLPPILALNDFNLTSFFAD